MPRFEDLDPDSQQFFSSFKCREDGPPPWTALKKPLSECKVAIVTSSGLIRKSDVPFDLSNPEGDPSYRVIPADTNSRELTFSHVSTNWDRTGFAMDVNVIFPVDRLKELVAEGFIGSLAENYYAFMGAIFNVEPLIAKSAPEVGRHLADAGVDIALMVPT
jgi:D-proline reductase (dithiol) PrdB